MQRGSRVLIHFWHQHPALLAGVALLLGVSAALSPTYALAIPAALLVAPVVTSGLDAGGYRRRLVLAVALAAAAYVYAVEVHQIPGDEKKQKGTAHIAITAVNKSNSPFGKGWIYQARLRSFVVDGTTDIIARNIPVTMIIPRRTTARPPANSDYTIANAELELLDTYHYRLKLGKNTYWQAIPGSWSLAEFRFQIKQRITRWITANTPSAASATFLAGIATGTFSDRLLAYELARFGLQHIMAISGFHFAITAALLSFFLRFLLPPRASGALLMAMLAAYFLFLGCGPSILRAWITATIALIAQIAGRRAVSLNTLGVALVIVLLSDPFLIHHIGFQFSFAATAAILLLFPAVDLTLQKLLQKRSLATMVAMNRIDQHGYLLLSLLRKAAALTFAVHLIVIPMSLYHFHKFSWLGIVYNLFFPFLVSIALFMLLIACMTALIAPPISHYLALANSTYTDAILATVTAMPLALDFTWRTTLSSSIFLIAVITTLFTIGIAFRHRQEQERWQQRDFAFI